MRSASIILLLFVATSSSYAAVLCARKSGAIVLRESCGKRERAVDPSTLGVTGPRGDTGPAGPAGPATDTLPDGTTMRGVFAIDQDAADFAPQFTAISFGLRVRGPGANGGPITVYVP